MILRALLPLALLLLSAHLQLLPVPLLLLPAPLQLLFVPLLLLPVSMLLPLVPLLSAASRFFSAAAFDCSCPSSMYSKTRLYNNSI